MSQIAVLCLLFIRASEEFQQNESAQQRSSSARLLPTGRKNRPRVHSRTDPLCTGEIRAMTADSGEVLFVGKNVATALGYAKSRNALAAHVDEEDKKDALIQGPLGGTQKMVFINESGLYSLILRVFSFYCKKILKKFGGSSDLYYLCPR